MLGGDCAGMLRNLALGLHPECAMEIIGDLIEQKPKTSWQEFIQGPAAEDRRRHGSEAGASTRKPQSARDLEAKNWQEFLRQLARII